MAISACNGFGEDADDFIMSGVVVTGAVIWVDSANGDDADAGTEAEPLQTLGQAITNATANNGDIIIIKSGHSESPATITINKAGVRIFGLGDGTDAPTFTNIAAQDLINITADDVELNNLYFPAGTTIANTARVNVAADRVRIKNCRFVCGQYDAHSITLTASASNFTGDSISMSVSADGPDTGIVAEGVMTGMHLVDCSFDGSTANWDLGAVYSTAAILNYRFESITLTNAASIILTSSSAKGQMGDLIEGDGSQVQA